jgi:signal recognition particle subunit SRP54
VFDNLSDRLQAVMKKLTGRGKLSEADVDAAMREVRLALLEADVNFRVVKDFVARVRERAVGAEVMSSLTPGQAVVRIVNEELTDLMGSTDSRLALSNRMPAVVMLVGLQGSGKTTAAAKLANHLRKQGRRPMMIACDVYRPAAIDQLQTLGKELDIPVHAGEAGGDPVAIAQAGVKDAVAAARDVAIVDTAGRLHVDEEMMDEARRIRDAVRPDQILLVVDAMTGQDAVGVAESFQERVDFDGVIITKLDGDARGGAALSVRAVTGKPIKFAGVGEKLDALEVFHPDRMARRILGMGDVLSLIEKAEAAFEEEQAEELEERLRKAEFTLDDFLGQLGQLKKMGSMEQVLSMMPGPGGKALKGVDLDESALVRTEAIIQSMTLEERAKPKIINGSRRERIAAGAGVTVYDVNQLLKQFAQVKKLLKQFSQPGKKGRRMPRMPGGSMPF